MKVRNDSPNPITVYVTLGATPGCVQDVALLTVSDGITITKLHNLMGTFVLPSQTTVDINAPAGDGFNGNFAINTPPLNCPTTEWPEGVNLAEFIINNGFQVNGQETVDISCVCGANALLEYELSADDWTDGFNPVKIIKNKTRFENLNISGVYPYGCDNCTASTNPPECIGVQSKVNDQPICNVQRPASSNQGGTVTVVFKSFTPVPL